MTVRMLRARLWQDAGQERQLDVGGCYELPDAIAVALIATGAAEHAQVTVPERKPILSYETKARRRA